MDKEYQEKLIKDEIERYISMYTKVFDYTGYESSLARIIEVQYLILQELRLMRLDREVGNE